MMQAIRLKIGSFEREERIYYVAFVLSLILHIILLLIFMKDLFVIDLSLEEKDLPEEVTVLFPENKPRLIVENINENDEIPDISDLLSDRNSRARNEQLLTDRGNQPMSEGNVPTPNLTMPYLEKSDENQFQMRSFDKDALVGEEGTIEETVPARDRTQADPQIASLENPTTNNIFDQNKLSVDDQGSMTLSTYAWDWAPYMNALKRKLHTVWYTPIAYNRFGLISGHTVIRFTLSKGGRLLEMEVLEHDGHESLEKSSVNAISAVFPFKSLPGNFPDETLTITAHMTYPSWRTRR